MGLLKTFAGLTIPFYEPSPLNQWLTPCGVMAYSSQTNPYKATKSIDDNTGTLWLTGQEGRHWIEYDLCDLYMVTKFRVYIPSVLLNRYNYNCTEIFVAENYGDWGTRVGYKNYWYYTSPGWKSMNLTPKVGRYVRWVFYATTGCSTAQKAKNSVYEVDLYV